MPGSQEQNGGHQEERPGRDVEQCQRQTVLIMRDEKALDISCVTACTVIDTILYTENWFKSQVLYCVFLTTVKKSKIKLKAKRKKKGKKNAQERDKERECEEVRKTEGKEESKARGKGVGTEGEG